MRPQTFMSNCSQSPFYFRMDDFQRLTRDGQRRLRHALRPSTWANHRSHFKVFLCFCYDYGQNPVRCSMETILAFTQFLIEDGLKAANINNYLGSVKTVFKWLKINTPLLTMDEWSWNLRSISRVLRDPPTLRSSITIEHLRLLCMLCFGKALFAPLRVFLTFTYFGLFRISNVVLVNKQALDSSRNTLVGDVQVRTHGIRVMIKWTKTRQTKAFALIPLPTLREDYICPLHAWAAYRHYYPAYTANKANPMLADPTDPTSFGQPPRSVPSSDCYARWQISPSTTTRHIAFAEEGLRSCSRQAWIYRTLNTMGCGCLRPWKFTSVRTTLKHLG